MKYNVKESAKNIVEIEITLDNKEWETELENAYLKKRDSIKMEGFRKGKAPRKMIEKVYGPSIFFEDALEASFNKYYGEVLAKETSIDPVDYPQVGVKSMDENGVTITAKVTVSPKVELGAYKGLGIAKKEVKVTKKQIDEELERVRVEHSRMVDVDREVKNGDVANIDFSGSVDGKKFDGGTAKNYDLNVGSHTFIEGFEEQIEGMKVGETKDIKVKFPENYHSADLAGKDSVFEVKVNAVKERVLPELNDEFASDASEFETLDAMKEGIKAHIAEHMEEHAVADHQNAIIDAIAKNAKADIPACMVDQEVEAIMQDMNYRLMYQGVTLEDYAKYTNTTVDAMKQERRKDAEKGVKIRLALQEIVAKENLQVSDKELDEKIEETAKKDNKTAKELKSTLDEHKIFHMKNDILMNKLLKFLVENNK